MKYHQEEPRSGHGLPHSACAAGRRSRLRFAAASSIALIAALWTAPGAAAQRTEAIAPSADERLLDGTRLPDLFESGAIEADIMVTLHATEEMENFRDYDNAVAADAHRRRVFTLEKTVLDGLDADDFMGRHYLENVPAFSGTVTAQGFAKLLTHPLVRTIELDGIGYPQTAQGIALLNAHFPRTNFPGLFASIAIADTGINYNHAALGGGGFPNAKVIGGFDLGDQDNDPMDVDGHGTACAGVAAGQYVPSGDYDGGVAPGAKLYALKITSGTSDTAQFSTMYAAWDWCVTNKNNDPVRPILAINLSFGGGRNTSRCGGGMGEDSATAVTNAGILNFVAAGNDGFCNAISTPACVPGAIPVGAVYDSTRSGSLGFCVDPLSCVGTPSSCSTGSRCEDQIIEGNVTCYSNSASFLELLAPADTATVPNLSGSGHSPFNGTSAATPYSAGSAAVLLDAVTQFNDSITPADLLAVMKATGVQTLDPKSGISTRRVNVAAALSTLYPGKWVNFGHSGTEDGSVGRPFNTLAEGIAASGPGATLNIRGGSTGATPMTISSHVTLRPYRGALRIGP